MSMRDEIVGLPDQLRWAAALHLTSVEAALGVVLCGMGGSAMAADVAAMMIAHQGRTATVHRGYGLPGWVDPRHLVVAVSYSGDTEETLSAVEDASSRGVPIAVVSSGGMLGELAAENGWPHVAVPAGLQPRAALGYLAGATMRLLESATWLTGSQASLEEAAEIVEDIVGNGAGSGASEADKIAAAIEGRVAIIYGAIGITALAARRWKTQVNENAKWPAFWSELPELDHNEIVGWAGEMTRDLTALVWLRDDAEGERLALRAELTRDLIESETSFAGEVWSRGSGALARLFSLVSIGDLASLALAERRGVDPVAVERIEELKQRLRGDRT